MPEKTEVDKKADKGVVVVPLKMAHLLDAGCLPATNLATNLEGGKKTMKQRKI